MITFLRINSPFQLFALALLLLLFKLPFISGSLPMLLPELEWMLIGEKMNDGYNLYTDIWTNVPPLSAFVYWVVDTFLGRDKLAYEFVAYLFIFFQATYLSIMTNRREIFLERNYVVGAVYILLANISFDFGKLSPALMATTFLMIALNSLAKQISNRDGVRDDIFEVGLFIGIATLFHLPMAIFLVWLIAAVLLFTGANFRQIILLFLGFVLTLFIVAIYYYFISDFDTFKLHILSGSIQLFQFSFLKLFEIIYVLILPLVIGAFGYYFLIINSRYNGWQSRIHQITLLGVLFGFVAFMISPYKIPMQLYGMLPFLAILVAGFFLHLKGTYRPEIAFIAVSAIVLLIQYQGVKPIIGNGFKHIEGLRVSQEDPPSIIKGKKMLIIGERIDEYQYGQQVTAYLNWGLSKKDLAEPNDYESVVNIFDNFRQSPPEVIIDKENVIPTIFMRIPELAKDYKKSEIKGIYLHK